MGDKDYDVVVDKDNDNNDDDKMNNKIMTKTEDKY